MFFQQLTECSTPPAGDPKHPISTGIPAATIPFLAGPPIMSRFSATQETDTEERGRTGSDGERSDRLLQSNGTDIVRFFIFS